MSDATEDTFYLGLTMAGAISAGAYTAGVLDTLFEALEKRVRVGFFELPNALPALPKGGN